MLKFKKINMNPKGRKTGDCSTRAISYALGISWEEALDLQVAEAKKCFYDVTSHQVMERVLAKFGYVKHSQPRTKNNLKYPIYALDKCIAKADRDKKIVCNVAHHYVVIDGDSYVDTWDSGCKCCGNYYVKENERG